MPRELSWIKAEMAQLIEADMIHKVLAAALSSLASL
jgi:hypothetical protein